MAGVALHAEPQADGRVERSDSRSRDEMDFRDGLDWRCQSPGPDDEAGGGIWRSAAKLIGRRGQSQWAGAVGVQIRERCEK